MNAIMIRDLCFKYDDKMIFDHFNLDIKKGSWATIAGPNGSGKSTLVKILLGLLKSEGTIIINELTLTHVTIEHIRESVGVVFDNPDNQFVSETVADEIAFKLENLGVEKAKIRQDIMDIANLLDIKHLLNKEPHKLNNGEKQLVILASALINKPKVLILDEALSRIDIISREIILKVLADYQSAGMTIINITHNLEDTIYSDDVVVLNDGQIVLNGSKEEVLVNEKIFSDLGLELPFMVQLSLKLKFYNLVDKLIFNMEEMVDLLWK